MHTRAACMPPLMMMRRSEAGSRYVEAEIAIWSGDWEVQVEFWLSADRTSQGNTQGGRIRVAGPSFTNVYAPARFMPGTCGCSAPFRTC